MISLLKDLGWHVAGEIWGDASAALGIINRRGFGKTRHIDTGLLWIQQTAAEKRFNFHKVLGKVNPADLFTKHLDQQTTDRHTSTMAFEIFSGRVKEAPKLHTLQNGDHELCQCVKDVCEALNGNTSATKDCKRKLEQRMILNMLGCQMEWSSPSTQVSLARRQSEELYCIRECNREHLLDATQKLAGSPKGTEQLGVAATREGIVSIRVKETTNSKTQQLLPKSHTTKYPMGTIRRNGPPLEQETKLWPISRSRGSPSIANGT